MQIFLSLSLAPSGKHAINHMFWIQCSPESRSCACTGPRNFCNLFPSSLHLKTPCAVAVNCSHIWNETDNGFDTSPPDSLLLPVLSFESGLWWDNGLAVVVVSLYEPGGISCFFFFPVFEDPMDLPNLFRTIGDITMRNQTISSVRK